MLRAASYVVCFLVGASATQWIMDDVPSIHEPSEYPPDFDAWNRLEPAWQHLHKQQNMSSNSLPFLPCVSKPNLTMSDGAKIYTIVVNPWPCNKKKSAVVVRSPYGPTTRNIALVFVLLNGFAAVMQDQRGTFGSGGTFNLFRNDGQDGLETFNWIKEQSWSNGEFYTAGISADGISTLTPSIFSTNPIKGQWSMYTTPNGHTFCYPQGAYRWDLLEGYLKLLDLPTGGASMKIVEPDVKRNEAFGPWWYNLTDAVNLSTPDLPPGNHYKNVHWPIILSVGWWDIFQGPSIRAMKALIDLKLGDPAWIDKHAFIVDPLGHCIIGNTGGFGFASGRMYKEAMKGIVVAGELASEYWSGNMDGRVRSRIGRVNFFIMRDFANDGPKGPGNYWTSLNDWPEYMEHNLYMRTSGKLGDSAAATPAFIEYTYDPTTKDGLTPMLGGNNLPTAGKIWHCGSSDQTKRENRSDVIVFDSDVLSEDLAVVGGLTAKLFVSSSAKDTDFVVTVSDLGTKSMLVRYGNVRMRWRNGGSEGNYITTNPPLSSGTVYEVDVDLHHTAYIFPKGHRVRVAIASAASPYYDANPNTGSPESESIAPSKFTPLPAKNVLHVGPEHPSRVSLPVVKMQDIPENVHFGPTIPISALEGAASTLVV